MIANLFPFFFFWVGTIVGSLHGLVIVGGYGRDMRDSVA